MEGVWMQDWLNSQSPEIPGEIKAVSCDKNRNLPVRQPLRVNYEDPPRG